MGVSNAFHVFTANLAESGVPSCYVFGRHSDWALFLVLISAFVLDNLARYVMHFADLPFQFSRSVPAGLPRSLFCHLLHRL
jgi:hypothetical protein